MNIKYRQLLGSVPAFKELQGLKLPPRNSLDIYKLGKALDKEIEAYQDLSKELYKRHKVPQTQDGFDLTKLKTEDFDALAKDLDELLDSEIDLKDVSIPVEVFEKYDIPITASMLIALDWLIKVEEDQKEEEAPKAEAAVASE